MIKTTVTSSSKTWPFKVAVTVTSCSPVPALSSLGFAASVISVAAVSSSSILMITRLELPPVPT